MGQSGGAVTDLFSLVPSDRTQKNGPKLCQGSFRLDIKKMLLTQRLARNWSTLPREADMVSSMSDLKKYLYESLRHMVCFLGLFCARPGP